MQNTIIKNKASTKKVTNVLKIKSGNIATAEKISGTIENLVFCKNGVIKLKKNVVKSKL